MMTDEEQAAIEARLGAEYRGDGSTADLIDDRTKDVEALLAEVRRLRAVNVDLAAALRRLVDVMAAEFDCGAEVVYIKRYRDDLAAACAALAGAEGL